MKKIIQLFILAIVLVLPSHSNAQVPEQDSLALVAFYNSTNGANWTNNTNWLNGQVSTWAGITVQEGRVYTISLANNNITGTIPTDIGNLTGLRNIILNDNQLTREIPTEIGLLTELSVLNLTNNQMSGSIPSEIANLNMSNLSLGSNNFSGSIPSAIGTWEFLYNLHLHDNKFTSLPTLSNLPEGTVVRVENNRLEFDDIEPNINKLTSYAPQDSIGVSQSKKVDYGNTLILTTSVGGSQNSYQWYKNDAVLVGQNNSTLTVSSVKNSDAGIYHAVVNNSLATDLTLYGRPNTVTIDNPLLRADSLALGALFENTGGFQWNDVTNWFVGPVDTWYGVKVIDGRVQELSLSNNNLNGYIPPEIGLLTELTRLDLNSNRLSDNIPSEIGQLTSLTYLDLSANDLTQIPSEIGQLVNLEYLILFGNQFSNIPSEIGQLAKLSILTLHDNNLVDLPNLSTLPLIGLSVENNALEFDDIEANINIPSFTYSPQDSFGVSQIIVVPVGEPFTIPATIGGTQNTYQWYINDVAILGRTNDTISIPAAVNGGIYHAVVNNSIAPELTLIQKPIVINIYDPLLSSDSLALATFYNSTGGPNWTNKTNWLVGSLSNWHGVTVTDGRVRKLELTNNNIKGIIPPEIGLLTGLTILDLSAHKLVGVIPKEIGQLSNLEVLNLGRTIVDFKDIVEFSGSALEGSIPPEIGELSSLKHLILSTNVFTFIPSQIGQLNRLISLEISDNRITGIPPEIGQLNLLQNLNFHRNQLTSIPTEIGQLNLLLNLDLSLNKLTSIPSEISNLINLKHLKLDFNEITSFPEVTLLRDLTVLNLAANNIEGSIPSEIGNLQNLRLLSLSSNKLTGIIPPEIGNMNILFELDISANRLTGSIPAEIGNLSNLRSLDLRKNQLTGDIPQAVFDLPHLAVMDLSYNMLNLAGYSFEHYTLRQNELRELIMNNNLFGKVPLGKRSNVINSIPPEIANLAEIEVFDISNNYLTGVLPAEIGLLDSLKVFKLGSNEFSGNLPEEIGNLNTLDTLVLSSNSFSGEMPLSMTQLTNLGFFNFDSTQLVVPNDTSFQNWLSNIPDSIATSVEIEDSKNTIPTEYLLEQNYPNPFNPTTTIQYSIPNVASSLPAGQASFSLRNVQLRIYDILGREVMELVNENQSAGNYVVKFNASDLTSGVYFYRLQAGDFTQIKKMILMK